MTDVDLNRWSAERVMQWDNDGAAWHEKGSLVWRIKFEDWTPLTDLNQAFMVVEKMRELGWWLYIRDEFVMFRRRSFSIDQGPFNWHSNKPISTAILTAAHAALEGE